jgi:hypothetical protein
MAEEETLPKQFLKTNSFRKTPQAQDAPEQALQKTSRLERKIQLALRENFRVSHFLSRVFPQAAANSL